MTETVYQLWMASDYHPPYDQWFDKGLYKTHEAAEKEGKRLKKTRKESGWSRYEVKERELK